VGALYRLDSGGGLYPKFTLLIVSVKGTFGVASGGGAPCWRAGRRFITHLRVLGPGQLIASAVND
jgi:hypothetical protein